MIKKSLTTIFLSMLIGVFTMPFVVIADDESKEKDKPIELEKFNVTNYLSVKNLEEEGTVGDQEQEYITACRDGECNPVASFLLQIVNFLALTIGSVAFITTIIGGFMIMTSSGNETQMNRGKEILTYAVIGLVISLTSFFIVAFVQSLVFEL
ncbi:hypothetical protein GF376_02065 [Candidatus Peregrinibacteria bacterium]|nr:hypothetical protein [Candidatus Peregrinibacteria bacterium]